MGNQLSSSISYIRCKVFHEPGILVGFSKCLGVSISNNIPVEVSNAWEQSVNLILPGEMIVMPVTLLWQNNPFVKYIRDINIYKTHALNHLC